MKWLGLVIVLILYGTSIQAGASKVDSKSVPKDPAGKKSCQGEEKTPCKNGYCEEEQCICNGCWLGKNCDIYVNKHDPVFTESLYRVIVSENVKLGSSIITVRAEDKDISEACSGSDTWCPCAKITYSIVSGNEQGYFHVDNVTGEVSIASINTAFLQEDASLTISAQNPDMGNEKTKKTEKLKTNSLTTVYISKSDSAKKKRSRRSFEMIPDLVLEVSHTNASSLVQGSVYQYKTIIKHSTSSSDNAYGAKIKWALPPYIKYKGLASFLPENKQPIITESDTHVEFKYMMADWVDTITFIFDVTFDPTKTLEPGRHHIVTPVFVTYYDTEYAEDSQGQVTRKGKLYSIPVKMYTLNVITTGCAAPLGLEDGKIKDFQITASTAHPNTPSTSARPQLDAWCAVISDQNQFLQVDFLKQVRISKVTTWRRARKRNWVTEYSIKFSLNDIDWYYYMENGKTKVFKGNDEANVERTHWLTYPIRANHIRIIPLKFKSQICLRLELYGCTDKGAQANCLYPLGMESGYISDEAISDSFKNLNISNPTQSRLNKDVPSYPNGWMGKENSREYLQIDFGSMYRVTRVATQGAWVASASELPPYYTKTYELEFSNNSYVWHPYKEDGVVKRLIGNTKDENAGVGVYSNIKSFVVARYIRIYPIEFKSKPVLRTEIYGCLYEPNFGKALPEFSRRTFLLDPFKNKVYICLLKPRGLSDSHCFSTTDGSTWKELSNEVCSIFGLDKNNGYLYAIGHLGQKYYVSKDDGNFWQVIANDEWNHRYDSLDLERAINIPDNLVSAKPTENFSLKANSGEKWGVSGYGVFKYGSEAWTQVATWDCCAE